MTVVVGGGEIVGLAAVHALADPGRDIRLPERDGLETDSTPRRPVASRRISSAL